jgi:hypothetical protein
MNNSGRLLFRSGYDPDLTLYHCAELRAPVVELRASCMELEAWSRELEA